MVIRLLMLLGLAWNVATPSPTLRAKFNGSGPRLGAAGAETFDSGIDFALAADRAPTVSTQLLRANDVIE
jgi:hypothetical protein